MSERERDESNNLFNLFNIKTLCYISISEANEERKKKSGVTCLYSLALIVLPSDTRAASLLCSEAYQDSCHLLLPYRDAARITF